MTRYFSATIWALAATATPALADLTPQAIWEEYSAYMEGMGYTLHATETQSGDVLTLNDLIVTVAIPEVEGGVKITMPPMTLTQSAENTVEITMPNSGQYVVTFSDGAEDTPAVEMKLSATHDGLLVTAIGSSAHDMAIEMAAQSLSVTIDSIEEQGEALSADALKLLMTMGPVAGTANYLVTDANREIKQDVTYGDMSYDVSFADPENEHMQGVIKGSFSEVTATGTSVIPLGASFANPMTMFVEGMAMDAVMSFGSGQSSFDFTDENGQTKGESSSKGGEFVMKMSSDSMVMDMSSVEQAINMTLPDMPFPISASFEKMGLGFEMPLAESQEPKPAGVSILLSNFTMADGLWDMFDPSKIMPRDPATISANLDAQVTPFVSLMDEEKLQETIIEKGVPGELNALTLTDFVVDAIGGKILGEGAFTFDNSDLESFGGMPRPLGQIDLKISGINGVIDRLIEMGVVQEQDAMGTRMMLGMFTVPGSEPDTASSVIKVNEQGHVLANGQRIK